MCMWVWVRPRDTGAVVPLSRASEQWKEMIDLDRVDLTSFPGSKRSKKRQVPDLSPASISFAGLLFPPQPTGFFVRTPVRKLGEPLLQVQLDDSSENEVPLCCNDLQHMVHTQVPTSVPCTM